MLFCWWKNIWFWRQPSSPLAYRNGRPYHPQYLPVPSQTPTTSSHQSYTVSTGRQTRRPGFGVSHAQHVVRPWTSPWTPGGLGFFSHKTAFELETSWVLCKNEFTILSHKKEERKRERSEPSLLAPHTRILADYQRATHLCPPESLGGRWNGAAAMENGLVVFQKVKHGVSKLETCDSTRTPMSTASQQWQSGHDPNVHQWIWG